MGVRRNEGKERRKKDNVTCCADDEPVVECWHLAVNSSQKLFLPSRM